MPIIKTINPATESTLHSYDTMSDQEVDAIIQQMHGMQQHWRQVPVQERAKTFLQLAELLQKNTHRYAELITQEMGKPITQSRGEIQKCAVLCQYYAEHAAKQLAAHDIATEKSKSYVCYEPLGIVYAVMPWNFPFWQVLRFAVPNLIAGNAALLKHSQNVTGCALAIEQLMLDAGLPQGLMRSVIIDTKQSPAVIAHPLVRGVTLTGSEHAGKAIAGDAAKVLKKVVMELGGSDPYLILDDADLDLAAQQCVTSRLNNAGQVCIAAKRIIVVDAVREAFTQKILERVKAYQCGDPMDSNTQLGPMTRGDLRDTLHQQVQQSIQAGAICLLTGGPKSGPGYFYEPTVLTQVQAGMPAYDEELFGPVVSLLSAANTEEAIQIANDSAYGLGAAVFTQDSDKGERIARYELEAGTCTVNTLVASDPRLPFGGIKLSGYGRELAAEGIREFMNTKTVVIS